MRAAFVLALLVAGCVSPEVYERAESIIILDGEPDTDIYRKMEQLVVTERFDSLRPDQARVIDKLKLRAAKIGADALGNLRFEESESVRITNTPQYIQVTAFADAYKRRPAGPTSK